MSAHTPGPWTITAASRAVVDSRGWDVCRLPNAQGPISIDEYTANARLIAAAPAMLEALTAIAGLATFPVKDAAGNKGNLLVAIEYARIAIAQAERKV